MSIIESNTDRHVVNIRQEISRPAFLQFDPTRYLAELDAFDISEEQKQELLSTIWSILCSFVELGFSVDVCTALLSDTTTIPDEDSLS